MDLPLNMTVVLSETAALSLLGIAIGIPKSIEAMSRFRVPDV
jgi:hypothetical protein